VFVVDTNVLVYAADEDASAHGRCREGLEEWRRQRAAWYTTWGILYEFLRISTHPRVLRNPWTVGQAWSFVEALLTSPGLGILVETDRHAAVAEQVLREVPDLRGNLLHDAHTAILMREHGIRRIYTRDTDFHRFPFLDVLDPLRT
jgi:toxin-antitoxin system PIN domain toxin